MASEKVRLVLKEKRTIRGKEYKAGTVVFEGACPGDFTIADVEKGIQLQAITVDPKAFEAEERARAAESKKKSPEKAKE